MHSAKIKTEVSVSAILPTFNIRDNLGGWYESVGWASEKIAVDMGSSDGTLKLCKKLGLKVVHYGFLLENFDKARWLGMGKADEEWIMKLDGDERIPLGFQREIIGAIKTAPSGLVAIGLKNRLFFCGKEIRYGHGSGDGYEIRIVRKNRWYYHPFKFHQQILPTGNTRVLSGSYLHFNYLFCGSFISKNNKYTSYDSKVDFSLGKRIKFRAFFRPLGTFLKQFIYKKGFKDGVYGLILASLFSINNFIHLLKTWERQEE